MRSPADQSAHTRLLAAVVLGALLALIVLFTPPLGQAATPARNGAAVVGPQPYSPVFAPGVVGAISGQPAGGPQFCFIGPLGSLSSNCSTSRTITLAPLNPASISANGASTSVATATVVDAQGSAVTGDSVSFSASTPGMVTFGPVTDNGDGTYTTTITSSTTGGQVSITATDSSVSPSATSNQQTLTLTGGGGPGPAASVSVGLNPASIAANGASTSVATATVQDAHGNPVSGDTVGFSASPSANVTIGSVTNNGNGTYSATVTSTTTAGPVTITATDSSVSPSVSGHSTLTLTPGAATSVSVGLSPASIAADGSSTSVATATVQDAHGNLVSGDTVGFSASPSANVTVGSVTNNGNGTYSATVTSTTTAGPVTITATDSSVSPSISNQATLTLTAGSGGPGPATSIGLSLNPATIAANGISTSVATATVKDAHGNLINGDSIALTASPAGDVTIGAVTDNGNGTYSATVTSATTAGPVTITATDSSVTPNINGHSTLTLIQPSAGATLTVSVSPSAIPADGGASHAFAQAAVQALDGSPVAGDSVQFYVDGQPAGSPCLTASDGACHITLNSTSVVGSEKITAYDTSAALGSSNYVYLWMVQVPTTTTQTTQTTTTSVQPDQETASAIKHSLNGVLRPAGAHASIRSLLKAGAFTFTYAAPGAGRLTIAWYQVIHRKQNLIAKLTLAVPGAGKAAATIHLTTAGRKLLRRSKRVNVTADVSFAPSGQPAVHRVTKFTLH